MNRTNGRMADGSRQKFAEALLKVMKVYQFSEITVTQLSQEAGLSRKTFYRLFRDKEEILTHIFDGLFAQCVTEFRSRNVRHYWDAVQLYFDFWGSHRDILYLLGSHHLLPRMFEYVYRNADKIFAMVRSEDTARELAGTLPYLLAYSIGGMHSMLIKWVECGMNVPSTELIGQLRAGFQSPEL